MQCCMHKHNITRVCSWQMMESAPKTENLYGPHLNVSYPGHRTKFDSTIMKLKPNCPRSVNADMHPFKTSKAWLGCLKNTSKKSKVHRKHGLFSQANRKVTEGATAHMNFVDAL